MLVGGFMASDATFVLSSALAVALGGVLVLAAIAKLRDLASFELTLVRLLPPALWRAPGVKSRPLARGVVGLELTVGLCLLVVPSPLVAVVATALFFVFIATLLRARAVNSGCSCFGGGRRQVQPVQLVRGGVLVVAAVALAAMTLAGTAAPDLDAAGFAGPVLGAALLFVAVVPELRWRLRLGGRAPFGGVSSDAGISRRAFVGKSATGALALVGLSAWSGGTVAAAGPFDPIYHASGFDQCIDCCGSTFIPCISCCVECYNQTVVSHLSVGERDLCPDGSCFGCWQLFPDYPLCFRSPLC